ncbi:MAG: hypothetical protein KDE27_02725 [Planctomycetes bacterium]|nr:hypothetical protein [Planctomycetota bacterium]
MHLRLAAVLPFYLLGALTAQNLVVDGDLELHSAGTGCTYNNSNSAFNAFYANVHSFGTSGGIDIMAGACYGIAPHSGATKLALAWNNVASGDKDAMALDLSAPLSPGAVYQLSFQAEELPFGPGQQPFEIGLSTASNTFGTLVYSANTPPTAWSQHSIVLTAPFAATHLTVRCPQGQDVWIAFDSFVLTAGSTPATNTTLGATCGGPLLTASTRPVLGTSWDLDLAGLPAGSGFGFMLLGLADPATPLPSPPFPAGCLQRSDGVVSLLLTVPVPTPTLSVSIPLASGFLGLPLHAQGGGIALSPFTMSASNGLRGSIGDV